MEMKAQETKLQDAENDLKQLMADVTRAMEKAQEAVARISHLALERVLMVRVARPSPD
jgi:peptidoglycan hydrolase CwlO-like protein